MNKYKLCLRVFQTFFFDEGFSEIIVGGWAGLSWGWWVSRMVVVGKEGRKEGGGRESLV